MEIELDSPPTEIEEGRVRDCPIDVNAVVSYNLKAIRERCGWTQQKVADSLARITGHKLPQASISAMERGFDGVRRRRFDAHELYLFSVVFDVPIVYFFLPPPGTMGTPLADTGCPAARLLTALLGAADHLAAIDDRLEQMRLSTDLDPVMVSILGWHDHFRNWRTNRTALLARAYGDQLDDVADFLAHFAASIKSFGPSEYLQSTAREAGRHRYGPPRTGR